MQEGSDASVGDPVQFLGREWDRSVVCAGGGVAGDKLNQMNGSEIGVGDGEMSCFRNVAYVLGDCRANAQRASLLPGSESRFGDVPGLCVDLSYQCEVRGLLGC